VIFRFICTQPLVWGAVYDGDEYFGKMQGGGGGALRAPVLGAGFWGLAPVVRDWADLCGVVRRGRRFGPDAKLDEQSRYRWNQRSWRAAAPGAGRAGMDEDEPSGGGRRGLVEVPSCDERKAARPTARASRGDENGCDSTIAATSALFGAWSVGLCG
jgi:hypothetical protein